MEVRGIMLAEPPSIQKCGWGSQSSSLFVLPAAAQIRFKALIQSFGSVTHLVDEQT